MAQKIGVINGPNLNLLGLRDPAIYGSDSLDTIISNIESYARQANFDLWHVQSNSEAELIDSVHRAAVECHGLIINEAAYSHTSIALRDAIETLTIPVIEVHLSNIYKREEFRRHSYVSEVADGIICGLGGQGYILAFGALLQMVNQAREAD